MTIIVMVGAICGLLGILVGLSIEGYVSDKIFDDLTEEVRSIEDRYEQKMNVIREALK